MLGNIIKHGLTQLQVERERERESLLQVMTGADHYLLYHVESPDEREDWFSAILWLCMVF
jgi:hypothetical protein